VSSPLASSAALVVAAAVLAPPDVVDVSSASPHAASVSAASAAISSARSVPCRSPPRLRDGCLERSMRLIRPSCGTQRRPARTRALTC
jgi:hypothetical protein